MRAACFIALVALASGCGATQKQVGAGLAAGGLVVATGGAVAATDHCSPDADYCKDVVGGRPEVGVPVAVFGGLAAIAGVTLVATSHEHSPHHPRASPERSSPDTSPQSSTTSEWHLW